MKKIVLYILYAWSALIFLSGLNAWISTFGFVQGSEFGIQISILNNLGVLMMWFAIFTLWYTLPTGSATADKKTS